VNADHINGPHCRKFGSTVLDHHVPYGDRYFEACSALWYYEQAESDCTVNINTHWRVTNTTNPSTGLKMAYRVFPRKTEPEWVFGAFMALPINQFMATTPRGSDVLSDRVKSVTEKLGNMHVPVVKVRLSSDLPEEEEEE
jgi:hypothetical protein